MSDPVQRYIIEDQGIHGLKAFRRDGGRGLGNARRVEVMSVSDHRATLATELERLAEEFEGRVIQIHAEMNGATLPIATKNREWARADAAKDFATRLRKRAAELRGGEDG